MMYDSGIKNFCDKYKNFVFTKPNQYKLSLNNKSMKSRVLINFAVSSSDKASYTAACKSLGISVSDVCRRALNEAVLLSKKLQPSTPKEKDKCPKCGSTKLGQVHINLHRGDTQTPAWKENHSRILASRGKDGKFKGGKNYDCT